MACLITCRNRTPGDRGRLTEDGKDAATRVHAF